MSKRKFSEFQSCHGDVPDVIMSSPKRIKVETPMEEDLKYAEMDWSSLFSNIEVVKTDEFEMFEEHNMYTLSCYSNECCTEDELQSMILSPKEGIVIHKMWRGLPDHSSNSTNTKKKTIYSFYGRDKYNYVMKANGFETKPTFTTFQVPYEKLTPESVARFKNGVDIPLSFVSMYFFYFTFSSRVLNTKMGNYALLPVQLIGKDDLSHPCFAINIRLFYSIMFMTFQTLKESIKCKNLVEFVKSFSFPQTLESRSFMNSVLNTAEIQRPSMQDHEWWFVPYEVIMSGWVGFKQYRILENFHTYLNLFMADFVKVNLSMQELVSIYQGPRRNLLPSFFYISKVQNALCFQKENEFKPVHRTPQKNDRVCSGLHMEEEKKLIYCHELHDEKIYHSLCSDFIQLFDLVPGYHIHQFGFQSGHEFVSGTMSLENIKSRLIDFDVQYRYWKMYKQCSKVFKKDKRNSCKKMNVEKYKVLCIF